MVHTSINLANLIDKRAKKNGASIRKLRRRNAQDVGNHHHSNCLWHGCKIRVPTNKKGQHFVILVVLVKYVVHFRDPIILKHTHIGLMSHPKVVYFYHAWGRYHRTLTMVGMLQIVHSWSFILGGKNSLRTVTVFWDAGGSGKKTPHL